MGLESLIQSGGRTPTDTMSNYNYNQQPAGATYTGQSGNYQSTGGAGVPMTQVGTGPNGTFPIPGAGMNFPNINRVDGPIAPNSLQAFLEGAPTIQGAFPFLPLNPDPNSFREGNRDNLVNALAGPFFQNDPFELPGQGSGIGASLNFRLAQMLEGAGRGVEREGLVRQNLADSSNSTAARSGEFLLNAANQLVGPGAMDARFGALERGAREQNANSLNSTRNRLQDLGLAGAGMGQAPSILAAEAGAASGLQDTLLQLSELRASDERANLAAATGAVGMGEDIRQSTQVTPLMQLATILERPQNVNAEKFIADLFATGELQTGTALAQRGGTFMEEGGGALLGGIAGGLLSMMGGGG